MSGDYSRFGFNPRKDYKGVLLQQGRPLTDRDWNEQVAATGRRIQAGTYDTLVQTVVPSTTPDGFKLSFDSSGHLQIGRGRIYVDGILAENHGTGKPAWDVALAESYGLDPVFYQAVPPAANGQPYLPNPTDLPASGGPFVAYLDVWQREVTQFEDPGLIESALGVDTTTRVQTVWQLKFLGNVGSGVTCATPPDQINGWNDLVAPSAGRLTTATGDVPGQANPCIIPPTAGYTGLENQLYRVEVHDGGALGSATFKWSRDNASVTARVVQIIDSNHIAVDSVGKDDTLRFSDGDWIEITDDWREFNGLPGEMHRITVGDGVDDATRRITLDQPITAGLFPVDSSGNTDPARHTRIRRWEQQGRVFDKSGTVYVDLDTGATGTIATPATATTLLIENGILITFSVDPAGGLFRTGDYWVFAARANDGTVEILDAAPPLGIHHHYAKLAVVTFPGTITDCRVIWPPSQGAGDCACTRCVTPEGHADGSYPLQKAVDDVIANGGTVCLHEGKYSLAAPITITNAHSLHIKGQGTATILEARGGAFQIANATDVSLSDLAIAGGQGLSGDGAIAIAAATDISIERVSIALASEGNNAVGIALAALPVQGSVRECMIKAPVGIGNAANQFQYNIAVTHSSNQKGTLDLDVERNIFDTPFAGVRLIEMAAAQSTVRIAANTISGCTEFGIGVVAQGTSNASVNILDNRLSVAGFGIVAGTSEVRICGNDLSYAVEGLKPVQGMLLMQGVRDAQFSEDVQIVGNRIAGFGGGGIATLAPLSVAMIKQNRISGCGGGGIVVSALEGASNGSVAVENNVIENINPLAGEGASETAAAGIWIENANSAQIGGNCVSGIGTESRDARSRAGILVDASDRIAISTNEVSDIGPVGEFAGPAAGILVRGFKSGLVVSDNLVRRFSPSARGGDDNSDWMALVVTASGSSVLGNAAYANNDFVAVDTAFVQPKSPAVAAFAKALGPSAVARATASAARQPSMFARAASFITRTSDRIDANTPAASAAAPGTSNAAAPPPPAVASAALRGNHLEGHGRSPVVFVRGSADCNFSDNFCVLATPDSQRESGADVMISGRTIAAGNNRVHGGRVSLALEPQSKSYSVLGNLTLGMINVSGSALGDPWKPLNIMGA